MNKLCNIFLRENPVFTALPLTEALQILKTLAVIPVTLSVVRSELLAMRQDPDEPFRTFAARVQGKAETCEFQTTYNGACGNCNTAYNGDVYFTNEVIRDVLLNGIADLDICHDALSTNNIQKRPLTEVIAFVENKETATNANPVTSIPTLSSYRRNRANPTRNRPSSPSEADKCSTAECPDCGKTFHLFSKTSRGWNRKPHTRETCWKKNRDSQQSKKQGEASSVSPAPLENFGQVSSTNHHSSQNINKSGTVMPADHQIFSKGEWRWARMREHPTVALKLSFERQPSKIVKVKGITDSGAQSDMWSLDHYLKSGFKMSDLYPAKMSLNAANKSTIRIDGVFFAQIAGATNPEDTVLSCSMVYVRRDANALYLSTKRCFNWE